MYCRQPELRLRAFTHQTMGITEIPLSFKGRALPLVTLEPFSRNGFLRILGLQLNVLKAQSGSKGGKQKFKRSTRFFALCRCLFLRFSHRNSAHHLDEVTADQGAAKFNFYLRNRGSSE